jgi:hypothetical protein
MAALKECRKLGIVALYHIWLAKRRQAKTAKAASKKMKSSVMAYRHQRNGGKRRHRRPGNGGVGENRQSKRKA